MARPRKNPEPTQLPAEKSEKAGKTKKLKYTGPEGQVVIALNQALVPGESYDVPEELADQLVAGSVFWEE